MRSALTALLLFYLGCLSGMVSARPPGSPTHAPPVFSDHDLNRDGFIDRREYYGFRQRLRAREGPRRQAPQLHHFEEFDRDGDGLIDHDELVDRLQRGPPIGGGRPGQGHRFGPALPPGR